MQVGLQELLKTCNTSYLVARTAIDPIFPMSPIAPIVHSKTPSHLNLKAIQMYKPFYNFQTRNCFMVRSLYYQTNVSILDNIFEITFKVKCFRLDMFYFIVKLFKYKKSNLHCQISIVNVSLKIWIYNLL